MVRAWLASGVILSCFWASPSMGAPLEPADVAGAWTGGIEVGEDYIPMILRVDVGEELSSSILLLDRIGPAQNTPSTTIENDELRVSLNDSPDSPQILVLSLNDRDLTGSFVLGAGEGATMLGAAFTRIALVDPNALSALTGSYAFEDGQHLTVRASDAGFLVAYMPESGEFQRLFPDSVSSFFAGPTFERALPREIKVVFNETSSSLTWRDADGAARSAKRFEAPPRSLTIDDHQVAGADLELPLLRINAGTFDMGQHRSNEQLAAVFGLDSAKLNDPDPVRPTTLTRPFLVSRTEITNQWFDAFVRDTSYMTDAERKGFALVWNGEQFERAYGANWRRPGFNATSQLPAVMISWNDAAAFCEWMAERTGRAVRLPTEAEWEFACRAGTRTVFSFGDKPEDLDAHAWCASNASGPRPVGSKRANPWGIHDMHGNVWEWCADYYSSPRSAEPAVDPTGPEEGETRVLRGGSWINGPWSHRSCYRAHEEPTLAEPHIGFRIVVEFRR